MLHGDISIGNIVIVRFLPSIIVASGWDLDLVDTFDIDEGAGPLPILPATENTASLTPLKDPLPIVSATASTAHLTPVEGPLPIILATTDTANMVPFEDPPRDPALDVEFLQNLGSGGSVIDFDYMRSTGSASIKASVSLKPPFCSSYINHV